MCKVSIVIPIYNVFPLMRRCLDSALAQTLEEIEIICVDDGSTDGCADALREYESSYPKIRAIYKENGGLSSARNAGLNVARGEYVAFLDSDDWFEPNACEAAYRRAIETGAEITRFFSKIVWENGAPPRKKKRGRSKKTPDKELFGGIPEYVATDPVERLNVCHSFGGPNVWSKLWRRDFLERNGLRFYEGILWEDVDFTTRAALLATKVATLRQTLHYYWRRSDSIIGRRCGTERHAEDLTTSLDSAIDAALRAPADARTLDWLRATKLKMLAADFRAFADWNATETVARKLREEDWRCVFDPNFELPVKTRSFFCFLWELFFSDCKRTSDAVEKSTKRKKVALKPLEYRRDDFVDRGKKAIEESRAVSFDVFDTLLTRPFAAPSDLFLYIEAAEGAPGFAEERLEAERTARRRGLPEVTLDDVYREMKPERRFLAEREIEYERRTLTANPDVEELFHFALKLKKPVFIVSDMYLSSKTIRSFLQKNGLEGYEKLYVSSERLRTKASGELFDLVLSENGLAPKELVHFGDNVRSDVAVPTAKGIGVCPVEKVIDRYFALFPLEKHFYETTSSRLEASIVLGLSAIRQKKAAKTTPTGNYWKRLGYRYGGVAILAFLQFIEKTARENSVDELMFVARDGWTLEKAYSRLWSDDAIAAEYVYASRKISSWEFDGKTTPENEAASRERREILRRYFAKKTRPGATTIALVDTVSAGRFSALKLARACLPEKNTLGIYWCVATENPSSEFRYASMFPYRASERAVSMTDNWDLIEFLMTSPEPPVVALSADGEPVYAESNEFERRRARFYCDVSRGELDFIDDFVSFFGAKPPVFSGKNAVETINFYLARPTALDRRRMSLIWRATDSDHRTYSPLLSFERPPFGTASKAANRTFDRVSSYFVYWKSPRQKIWACVVKPASLKIKKNGIVFSLFPNLRQDLFRTALRLTRRFTLVFQIGTKGFLYTADH